MKNRPSAPQDLAGLRALLPSCMLRDRRRLEAELRRRGKRGDVSGQALTRMLEAAGASAALRRRRRSAVPPVSYPPELPISSCRDRILEALRRHQVVIVAGETGSGKTTQLPKMCLEAGRGVQGMIACTQPRRVAALSISSRVAEELGVAWGQEVGCRIRFTDETSERTLIKFMTDGMLLAEIESDRRLEAYDTIIVDEAHERSLNVDYLLGYLQVLRRRRRDLKIVITSATIDTAAFSAAFDDAPVIQVSGRMYPVEVRYWPLEELLQERGDSGYTDAAAVAVEQLLAEFPRQGDILVFMPTEGDVHETCDLLAARRLPAVQILPLFGRLTRREQQRVFTRSRQRRIVVATNIAETSLTIPRIRFVVDSGLARISRFNPRTRTQRLPIEPVARSSADQRKGRCGRVADGICVRLYSERDYLARPEYTEPEIKRADLADVILHMTAQRLGSIERFPFMDPPAPQAIKGGYELLQELGALDAERRLTSLGKSMARLPIAPTDARMLIQAHREGALREVLIIAAALGIQDPRERPLEQRDEADRMHRRFTDPRSDFLSLLNIWNAYHGELDRLRTQGRMRRFCRDHFLSYVRMREWRDIHGQLESLLRETPGFRFNSEAASPDAIHRSVLSGLLSNVARKREGNVYQAARGREVMIFPGSGMFRRRTPARRRGAPRRDDSSQPEEGSSTPEWIMAAEMVETSRLFARTVAGIQPEWLSELGGHLCRSSFREPYWNARSGRVLVQETLTLYGLEVLTRRIPYRRIAPDEATEIFIREALIPGQIRTPHPFLEHNVRLLQKLETWQTRVSRHAAVDLEEAAADFYRRHLRDVSSVHDLNRLVRAHGDDPDFLCMTEKDLLGTDAGKFTSAAFPDALDLDGEELPLQYAYRPGHETDGVTVKLPYTLAQAIQPEVLEWLVPGLLEEKIRTLLRALPKARRKQFIPLAETARSIAQALRPTHGTFLESLRAFLRDQYGVEVRADEWQVDRLPAHLRMRVEVEGTDHRVVAAGRDLAEIRRRMERHETPAELDAWNRAAREFTREGLKSWSFPDPPERVEVAHLGGVPLYGYPGLEPHEDAVRLRVYPSLDEARLASRQGWVRLAELVLAEPLKWLRRELRQVEEFQLLLRGLGTVEQVREQALVHLEEHLFLRGPLPSLSREGFERVCAEAREELRQLGPRFLRVLGRVLEARHQLTLVERPYPGRDEDLQRLIPQGFLRITPFVQLAHLERYLHAARRRAERYALDPAKDERMAAQVRPYAQELARLQEDPGSPFSPRAAAVEEFRWMVEEFRVSVFAQELGTAYPVSPRRLDKQLAAVEALER